MAGQKSTDITIIKSKSEENGDCGLETYLKEGILREQTKSARELFKTIQTELDENDEGFKEGLSFLDLKNDTLLSYMIDVCNIILRKARGQTIEGHKSVDRCVEYRVILEKIKALDQKLAYQLNKLITLPDDAEETDQGGIDVHNLDINLDGIESEGEQNADTEFDDETDDESDEEIADEDDSEEEEECSDNRSDEEIESDSSEEDDAKSAKVSKSKESKKKIKTPASGGVYKPPKLRSVAYIEKGESQTHGRRKTYHDFYQEDDSGDIIDQPEYRIDEERVRYEEDNYTRLPDENPKKAKRKIKTKEYRKKGRGNKRFKKRK